MRYLHKVMPLPSEAELDRLGKDGWCVVASMSGDRVVLAKGYEPSPHETAEKPVEPPHLCGGCLGFHTEKDMDGVGRCPEWNLLMAASSPGCAKWLVRTGGSVPDEVSAWHWMPRTEIGEKRIEAITSQVSGIVAPQHKHRVMVIRAKDGSVVRGKTDVVNGHDHPISVMGMVEESDGHTHTFLLPQES